MFFVLLLLLFLYCLILVLVCRINVLIFPAHYAHGCGSVRLWRRCNMFYMLFSFVYVLIFTLETQRGTAPVRGRGLLSTIAFCRLLVLRTLNGRSSYATTGTLTWTTVWSACRTLRTSTATSTRAVHLDLSSPLSRSIIAKFTCLLSVLCGSVAEWLACWTQAQKGLGSNRCRVTVLGKLFTPIVPLFTKQRNR